MAFQGRIKGTTLIEQSAVPRKVIALTYDKVDVDDGEGGTIQQYRVIDSVLSGQDGTFQMDFDYLDEVITIALDEYGDRWQPNHAYTLGKKIRPTSGKETGYVYQCTIAGTSGPTEPNWWIDDGGNNLGSVGTATFIAIEAWWPVAHAPIQPYLIEIGEITLDEFFDDVVLLTHGDAAEPNTLLDADWFNVTLLMHAEQDGGAQDFIDDSSKEHTLVNIGGVTLSGLVSKVGSTSAYFDGSQALMVEESGQILPTTNDDPVTIEAWVYPEVVTGTNTILGQYITASSERFLLQIKDSLLYAFHGTAGGGSGTTTLVVDTWIHVAVAFDGTLLKVYLDGVLEISLDWTTASGFASNFTSVGARHNGDANYQDYLTGYIDELRVTQAHRITAAFTPATLPFPDMEYDGSENFINIIANNIVLDGRLTTQIGEQAAAKFGTGAYEFTDSYIDLLSDAIDQDLYFSTGEYTIEFFLKPAILAGGVTILETAFNGIVNGLKLQNVTGATVVVTIGGVERYTTAALSIGVYTHLAISRVMGVTRFFVDGVQLGSDLADPSNLLFQQIRLGASATKTERLTGWIDDLRITKAGRYAEGFTPPVLAFPDSKFGAQLSYPTPLDLNYTYSTSIMRFEGTDGDLTSADDITSADPRAWIFRTPAALSDLQFKFGVTSLSLDGTDYIDTVHTDSLEADSNATIELWIRPDAVVIGPAVQAFLFGNKNGTTEGYACYIWNDTVKFQGWATAEVINITTATGLLTADTWHHIAVTRTNDGLWTLWVDGVDSANGTESARPTYGACDLFRIGAEADASLFFTGHVDDFRFTQSVDRYTAAFTPPTATYDASEYLPGTEPWEEDPYIDKVISLLNFTEVGGSLSITDFIDTNTWTLGALAVISGADGVYDNAMSLPAGLEGYMACTDIPAFGRSDFTIEMWIKVTTTGVQHIFFETRGLGQSPFMGIILYATTDGKPRIHANGVVLVTGPTSIQDGTWHYLAACRRRGVVALFVDGAFQGSALDSNDYIMGTEGVLLGRDGYAPAVGLGGVIGGFRLTMAARYMGNYTPTMPIERFPLRRYDPDQLINSDEHLWWEDVEMVNGQFQDGTASGWTVKLTYAPTMTQIIEGRSDGDDWCIIGGSLGGTNLNVVIEQDIVLPSNCRMFMFSAVVGRNDTSYDGANAGVIFLDDLGNRLGGGGVNNPTINDNPTLRLPMRSIGIVPEGAVTARILLACSGYHTASYKNSVIGGARLKVLRGAEMLQWEQAVFSNGDFELGNLTGWTTILGSTPIITTSTAYVGKGVYAVKGKDGQPDSRIINTITLPAGNWKWAIFTAYMGKTYSDPDGSWARLYWLDGDDNEISSMEDCSSGQYSYSQHFQSRLERVPAGAVKAKVWLKFTKTGGTVVNAGVDDIEFYLAEQDTDLENALKQIGAS